MITLKYIYIYIIKYISLRYIYTIVFDFFFLNKILKLIINKYIYTYIHIYFAGVERMTSAELKGISYLNVAQASSGLGIETFKNIQESNGSFGSNEESSFVNNVVVTVVVDELCNITFKDCFIEFITKMRRMSLASFAYYFIMVLLVTCGNAMQIIGLNFWLRSFPENGGPWNFATAATSSLLFGFFFFLLLVGYILVMRPRLLFLYHLELWRFLFLIGLFDAINSFMAIYAASYTPEVLQALFTSLVPVYAAFFTKWILEDPRNYCNMFIFLSFTLIVSGVLVVTFYHFFSEKKGGLRNGVFWSSMFFISVLPNVLMNVFQCLYMLVFTQQHAIDNTCLSNPSNTENAEALRNIFGRHGDVVINAAAGTNRPNSSLATRRETETRAENSSEHNSQVSEKVARRVYFFEGTDTIVKLLMLGVGTNIQFLLIMLAIPLDSVSWWGGSKSIRDSWNNFLFGLWCVFNCRENAFYCAIYTMGYIFTYIGSAHLNQYSVTLCFIIGQLSSPFTALLLVLVPLWNLEKSNTPWYLSVLAVILLSLGSFFYTVWEKKTAKEKKNGEYALKRKIQARLHSLYLQRSRA